MEPTSPRQVLPEPAASRTSSNNNCAVGSLHPPRLHEDRVEASPAVKYTNFVAGGVYHPESSTYGKSPAKTLRDRTRWQDHHQPRSYQVEDKPTGTMGTYKPIRDDNLNTDLNNIDRGLQEECKAEGEDIHLSASLDAMHLREERPSADPDPSSIYTTLEGQHRLARLEEPKLLEAAMTIVVRNKHSSGKRIRWPKPQAITRMELASNGVPADPDELETMVEAAFKRRNLDLDWDEVAADFGRAHGMIAFNPTVNFPDCYQLTFM